MKVCLKKSKCLVILLSAAMLMPVNLYVFADDPRINNIESVREEIQNLKNSYEQRISELEKKLQKLEEQPLMRQN